MRGFPGRFCAFYIGACSLLLVGSGCGDRDQAGEGSRQPSDTTAGVEAPYTPAEGAPDSARAGKTAGADEPGESDESEAGTWTHGVVEVTRARMPAVASAVRAARHPAFDRIVLEFQGDTIPGYKISYIDKPVRQCGSGSVVPIQGEGWLEVRIRPAQGHDDEGKPTVKDSRLKPGLTNLKELVRTCDFEGDVTWVAGLLSPNDFRVAELHRPARLVVDVRNK